MITRVASSTNRLTVERCLENRNKGVELGDGILGGGSALGSVLLGGTDRGEFNGLEEVLGGLLLFLALGKVVDGSTGLVHVSAEFVLNFEPLCLLTVCFQSSKTLSGLGEDGLLLGNVLVGTSLVEGIRTGLTVDRVRRVGLSGLISTVGGSLGVGGTVSDKSENRESRGFTGSGVGGSRDQSGSSSGDSGKGIPAGVLL